MAKENLIFLYGTVLEEPRITKDDDGTPLRAIVALEVIRGKREIEDNIHYIKKDRPMIMTANPELIAEIETWKKYDMVEVKGTLTTKEVRKASACPHCNAKNIVMGSLGFINPIYLSCRDHGEDSSECLELLKKHQEISNQAWVIGTLCREPKTLKAKSGINITQFQLAINRKYKIREDNPETKTDWPWVKSYGEQARKDKRYLHTGSTILVDGVLQARNVDREITCANCQQEYKWKDKAIELVPYSNEYLKDFYSEEEAVKREEESYAAAKRKIFGEEADTFNKEYSDIFGIRPDDDQQGAEGIE